MPQTLFPPTQFGAFEFGGTYDIDRFSMIVSAKEAPDGPPDLKVSAVQPTRQRLSCSSD